MGNQQLYAKIGVFVLLGVNVGAYYVLWPRQPNSTIDEANGPRAALGEVEFLPPLNVKPPEAGEPKEPAAGFAKDTEHTKKVDPKEDGADDLVRKLLAHMNREAPAGNPRPAFPVAEEKNAAVKGEAGGTKGEPSPVAPRPLPQMQAEPLDPARIGVTSPLTPKPPPSPWVLYTEAVGKQTLLVAKLQGPKSVVEFRILCDRIETRGNDVVALGNVAFSGSGLRGDCQRLTLPLLETRLLFEEQVHIRQDAGSLIGERLAWEFNANDTRGNFNVNPAVLGAPK
jgi:hypothetical protein